MSPPSTAPSQTATPLLITVRQAAELLGIGRTKLYELILTGDIPTVTIGRARRIPVAALYEYVDGLQRVSEA